MLSGSALLVDKAAFAFFQRERFSNSCCILFSDFLDLAMLVSFLAASEGKEGAEVKGYYMPPQDALIKLIKETFEPKPGLSKVVSNPYYSRRCF